MNLSRNKNEVLDMGDVKSFTTDLWDTRFLTEVGKPISQFYSYKTGGLLKDSDFDANGNATIPILKGQEPGNVKYVDVNGDGTINSGDWVVHGNYQPKLSWGMTNRFGLKNFDLSILMQGQFGGKVLFMGQRQYDNGSGFSVTRLILVLAVLFIIMRSRRRQGKNGLGILGWGTAGMAAREAMKFTRGPRRR